MREYLDSYVEFFDYVPPGAAALAFLEKNLGVRFLPLGRLPQPRSPSGLKQCAWCNSGKTLKGHRKYCTDACQRSAYLYCYPQSVESKAWRFIMLQNCICPSCGEDFGDVIRARVAKRVEASRAYYAKIPGHHLGIGHFDKLTLWQVGYGTGDLWHLDHVKPVHQGGDGIGMDNHQVLCVPCHKRKTGLELMREMPDEG